jgi:hypothetical protein
VSDKEPVDSEWIPEHPLFRTGTFHFPVLTRQGNSLFPGGHYNPVTDSIYLRFPEEEILDHEASHRIFSLFAGGVLVLRWLAGISHSLLYFLLDTVTEQQLQLVGRNLETLGIADSHSRDSLVETILSRLRRIEYIFESCYWLLVPPAEIAAIDFGPGEGKYSWWAEGIKNTEENLERKSQQIDAMAALLEQGGKVWLDMYDSVGFQEELRSVWEAYTSIEDERVREALLKLATSSVLKKSPDHYILENTLHNMRNHLQHAQGSKAEDILSEKAIERFDEMTEFIFEIETEALGDIPPKYRRPLDIQTAIHYLVWFSVPVPSNPVLPHLLPEDGKH